MCEFVSLSREIKIIAQITFEGAKSGRVKKSIKI